MEQNRRARTRTPEPLTLGAKVLAWAQGLLEPRERRERSTWLWKRSSASRRPKEWHHFLWIASGFALVAALISVKLVSLQVVSPDRLLALGTDQRRVSIPLLGRRGTIFDTNGRELALSVQLKTVVADPALVDQPEKAAELIATAFPEVDKEEILRRLQQPKSRFAFIVRQVNPAQTQELLKALKAAKIAGFSAQDEAKRLYPSATAAGALLGDVDVDGNGTAGVEQLLDADLKGRPGLQIAERVQGGGTIANTSRMVRPASDGSDVGLTIDQDMQYSVEQVLAAGVRNSNAKWGVAIVGRPSTGEILAVANVVADPKTKNVTTTRYNMAFATAVEPGSVAKMVTAAAAYDTGRTTPTEVLTIPTHLRVQDHTYSDAEKHPVEHWTVDEILAHSSNMGTIQLAQRVGKTRLGEYFKKLGFGQKTSLKIPHESAGILRNPSTWAPTDLASISIGQGVAVTPIQLWTGYSAIANGGVRVDPRLVKYVDAPGNPRKDTAASTKTRVMKESTAKSVSRGLQQVVQNGTATSVGIPGYSMAGKTGTAYKPNPKGGYQWPDGTHYTATFAGFFPASAPEVTITVVIDEPKNAHTGASAAGPVFKSIAAIAIRRLGIRQEQAADVKDSKGPVRATPASAAARRTTTNGTDALPVTGDGETDAATGVSGASGASGTDGASNGNWGTDGGGNGASDTQAATTTDGADTEAVDPNGSTNPGFSSEIRATANSNSSGITATTTNGG